MNNQFTCDKCKVTFIKGWSEKEANEEFKNSPWHDPDSENGVLCEKCFEDFKVWFDGLSKEETEKLKFDYYNNQT